MFKFDCLPDAQRTLWPRLEAVSELGFVLYGGTSVALRFGHRKSVDFDFFSSESFQEKQLLNLFPWLADCRKTQDSANSYSYITSHGAKITFLGGFGFGRIGYPDMDPDTGIQIASPEDVFALKLRALHDRVEEKDLLDIAEFIRQEYSLENAIMGANALIRGMPPPEFTMQALMWYDDPALADFPQTDRKLIAQACASVNMEKIRGRTLPLASCVLQDDTLLRQHLIP